VIDIVSARSEVFTAAAKKITFAWNVTALKPVDGYRRIRGTCCICLQSGGRNSVFSTQNTEAVYSSETSVSIYQIIRRHISEDSRLHGHLQAFLCRNITNVGSFY
jgi:hypothetical protein